MGAVVCPAEVSTWSVVSAAEAIVSLAIPVVTALALVTDAIVSATLSAPSVFEVADGTTGFD